MQVRCDHVDQGCPRSCRHRWEHAPIEDRYTDHTPEMFWDGTCDDAPALCGFREDGPLCQCRGEMEQAMTNPGQRKALCRLVLTCKRANGCRHGKPHPPIPDHCTRADMCYDHNPPERAWCEIQIPEEPSR